MILDIDPVQAIRPDEIGINNSTSTTVDVIKGEGYLMKSTTKILASVIGIMSASCSIIATAAQTGAGTPRMESPLPIMINTPITHDPVIIPSAVDVVIPPPRLTHDPVITSIRTDVRQLKNIQHGLPAATLPELTINTEPYIN